MLVLDHDPEHDHESPQMMGIRVKVADRPCSPLLLAAWMPQVISGILQQEVQQTEHIHGGTSIVAPSHEKDLVTLWPAQLSVMPCSAAISALVLLCIAEQQYGQIHKSTPAQTLP